MKNIHILPTDKPSRLCINGKNGQHIYITSPNEDINENDYIITKDGRLVEVSYLMSKDLEGASKVVLTTDELYIHNPIVPKEYNPSPQYIQKIDDEFLEWFVNNPSCEEVEVLYDYFQVDQNNPVFRGSTALVKQHKIIIPKEEPKQERMYSEEEVYHILCEHTAFLFAGGKSTLTDWFEKFKKR